MQFIPKGPDIPDSLIEAHEDGKVVFFCGAGISYPAGLPGFGGLVKGMYAGLGVAPNEVQADALKKNQYDTAIALLEDGYTRGRFAARSQLRHILSATDPTVPGALETHQALLTLASSREGRTRLITTNFDRLFEECLEKLPSPIPTFSAPLLPVPKNQWDGLVYLHGVLPANELNLEFDLNKLILSSGDFGRAYLTERWAARFVSDLFRNYVICFVGYSIDDPILRYMVDALAADRLLGERVVEAYAFGGCTAKKQALASQQWKAKGVIPILYRVKKNDHSMLHKTLQSWSETYRDGVNGKESLIVQFAPLMPAKSTAQDDYVGRVLWALSEPLGLAAKRFSELTPPPPFEWLDVFCEARYRHSDLTRFKVTPDTEENTKLQFSFESRPTPYSLAPRMSLRHQGDGGWDAIMSYLAQWLLAYIEDPRLFLWASTYGGKLHPLFADTIERHLRIKKIETTPATFWHLLLANRVQARKATSHDIYAWLARFKGEPRLSLAMRLSLREILSPRVVVSPPFDFQRFLGKVSRAKRPRLKDFANWEIALGSEYVHHAFKELHDNEKWKQALPDLLTDLTGLLKDTLDLRAELQGANEFVDLSYIAHPSIAEDSQNADVYEWTALITLLRDSWRAVLKDEPVRALAEVERWKNIKYPLFRRLVLFALATSDLYTPAQKLDVLLSDERNWLWSTETKNEVIAFLRSSAGSLPSTEAESLEAAVLAGPPAKLYREDLDPAYIKRIIDHEILEKLRILSEQLTLGSTAASKLIELTQEYPLFETFEDRQLSGIAVFAEDRTEPPKDREALALWLIDPANTQSSGWFSRCQRDFKRSATTLMLLAKRGDWSAHRHWGQALQAWSSPPNATRAWRYLSPVLATAPRSFLEEIQDSLSWWLESTAKVLTSGDSRFLYLIETSLGFQAGKPTSPPKEIGDAINHPVGRIVQGLFNWWYRQNLQDNGGIPPQVKTILMSVQDAHIEAYTHGRLITAANILTLFRVDTAWTEEHVLPFFDWTKNSTEALIAWQGFLWSPRLYPPLMMKLKPHLLATADHCDELGEALTQYSGFLTFAALEMYTEFGATELAKATGKLPMKGLVRALRVLGDTLKGASDRREAYWDNRTSRYMRFVWPKDKRWASEANIVNGIAELLVETDTRFPQALTQLEGWLNPLDYTFTIISNLRTSKLCERFPREALTFLDKVIGKRTAGISLNQDFGSCLDAIEQDPALKVEAKYRRLREIQRLAF